MRTSQNIWRTTFPEMVIGEVLSALDTRTQWLCQACWSYGRALSLVLVLAESNLEAVNSSWWLVPAGVPGMTFKNTKELECESGRGVEGLTGEGCGHFFLASLHHGSWERNIHFFFSPKCMTPQKYFLLWDHMANWQQMRILDIVFNVLTKVINLLKFLERVWKIL